MDEILLFATQPKIVRTVSTTFSLLIDRHHYNNHFNAFFRSYSYSDNVVGIKRLHRRGLIQRERLIQPLQTMLFSVVINDSIKTFSWICKKYKITNKEVLNCHFLLNAIRNSSCKIIMYILETYNHKEYMDRYSVTSCIREAAGKNIWIMSLVFKNFSINEKYLLNHIEVVAATFKNEANFFWIHKQYNIVSMFEPYHIKTLIQKSMSCNRSDIFSFLTTRFDVTPEDVVGSDGRSIKKVIERDYDDVFKRIISIPNLPNNDAFCRIIVSPRSHFGNNIYKYIHSLRKLYRHY